MVVFKYPEVLHHQSALTTIFIVSKNNVLLIFLIPRWRKEYKYREWPIHASASADIKQQQHRFHIHSMHIHIYFDRCERR